MRRLFGLIALLTAAFSPTSRADAEIAWDYVKPGSERSTGAWLADILGLSGFGQSYAVIIGLSGFRNFNPLDATAKDPKRVFDFLRNEAGFDYILMLRDDEVTHQALRELFEFELPNILKSNDRFLLFWSGHGTQFKNALGDEDGYLPLVSSSQNNKATMVNMRDLTRWDSELPVKQALFLLDACFSGLAGVAAQSDDKDVEIQELSKPGHHIISAGRSDEQTIASRQQWQGSIFTHALLQALRGKADRYGSKGSGDGVINLHELVADMGETVKHAKAAAGWNRPLRPVLNVFPGRGEGQFFFVTNEKKRAYLEAQGKQVGDETAYGMPVVIMGAAEKTPAATGDPYGGRDATVFDVIKDSAIAKDFEDFIDQFPDSAFAPYARNRVALLRQRDIATPSPTVTARIDPATEEMGLNLRPEDRRVVQEALTALGFDTRGIDGIFGANTRRAIIGWQRVRGEEPTGYLTATQYGQLLAEAEPKLALAAAPQKPEPTASVQPVVGVYHYQPGNEFRDCDGCPLMVVVPAGSFMMGSTEAERQWAVEQGAEQAWVDPEKPQHPVKIEQLFAVGKYEVTVSQFKAFAQAKGRDPSGGCWEFTGEWKHNASIDWRTPGFDQTDSHPVVCMSWDDAKSYIEWLSEKTGQRYRLLSEAEWEYAARAGTNTMRPWGDDRDNKAGCVYANGADLTAKEKFSDWRTMDCRDGQAYTAVVDSYFDNAFRLHDMIGNVWEWVEDCWNETYEGAPEDGSAWTSGDCARRVLRGGSWSGGPGDLRSALRLKTDSDVRYYNTGFRVARTLSRSESATP